MSKTGIDGSVWDGSAETKKDKKILRNFNSLCTKSQKQNVLLTKDRTGQPLPVLDEIREFDLRR